MGREGGREGRAYEIKRHPEANARPIIHMEGREGGREGGRGRTMTNIIQEAKALPMIYMLTPCMDRPIRTQPLSGGGR